MGELFLTPTRVVEVANDVEILTDHIHSRQFVYPTLANGVTVNGGAGAWALGDSAVIAPLNTLATGDTLVDIHYINVASASASDTYELVLYTNSGAGADVEIGRARITRATGTQSVVPVPFMCPRHLGSRRITAKVASSSGGDNVVMTIFYHKY